MTKDYPNKSLDLDPVEHDYIEKEPKDEQEFSVKAFARDVALYFLLLGAVLGVVWAIIGTVYLYQAIEFPHEVR